jgi:hypothetical protein
MDHSRWRHDLAGSPSLVTESGGGCSRPLPIDTHGLGGRCYGALDDCAIDLIDTCAGMGHVSVARDLACGAVRDHRDRSGRGISLIITGRQTRDGRGPEAVITGRAIDLIDKGEP